MLQSGLQCWLDGDEQEHELRRVQLGDCVVVPLGQFIHAVFHCFGVLAKRSLCIFFSFSFHAAKKGAQRSLGVNDQMLVFRQMHHRVGPQQIAFAASV